MENKPKHSELPYRVEGQNIVAHEANIGIARVYRNIGQPYKANAAFLVRAANSHYGLVDSIYAAMEILEMDNKNNALLDQLQAALAEAEKEA